MKATLQIMVLVAILVAASCTPKGQDQSLWLVEETEIPLYHSSTIDPASGGIAYVEYCGAKLSRGSDRLHLVYRPADFPDRNPGFARGDTVTLRGLDQAKDFGAMEGRDYWIHDVEVTKVAAAATRHYPLVEPQWPTPPATVTISGCNNADVTLEFSTDSRCLCVWWWPARKIGDFSREPGSLAVYDLAGKPVADACDANGVLTGEYAHLFPHTAWRTVFEDFIKDAGGWGFSRDYRLGLRLANARPGRIFEKTWTAELWQFQPETKRVWATEIPETGMPLTMATFFERDAKPLVLLAFGGTEGFILSQEDGALMDRFQYGHIETEQEQAAYKWKFHLAYSDGDPMLHFNSFALSCDPTRRLLACGAFNGRRVRVVSLDPPFRTIFEANTNDHPRRPWGGVWSVDRVEFVGSKYLIAGYSFGGRGTRCAYDPTDIFDTITWEIVWHENSLDIRSATISPDDRRMALMRKDVLEIGDFVPQTTESLSKQAEKGALDKIIAGRVLDVHMLGKIEEEVTICHVDPRYVVVVQTEDGLARFAIHSPAKTFSGEAPVGKSYRFYLSRSGNGFMLERVETIIP